MAVNQLFSHLDTISVVVSLAALPAPAAAFDQILFIDTLANSSLAGFGSEATIGSHGSKFIEIGATSEMTDANAATSGSVSTQALADISGALNHDRGVGVRGKAVGLLAVDLVGGDTYETILPKLDDYGYNEWYCVVPVSRTLTTICDIADAMVGTHASARKRVLVGQTYNSAAFGNGAGWAAARVNGDGDEPAETTQDRMFLVYHNTAQPAAAAIASWALSWSPDTQSAPWTFPVPSVATLTFPSGTSISTAKSNLRTNNVNVALPLAGTNVWLDPGVSQTGRPFYVNVSADWFEARLKERLGTLKTSYGSMGIKLPLNSDGQKIILAEIEAVYTQGVQVGHFLSRAQAKELGAEVLIRAETITNTDKTERKLRFTVRIPILLDARLITIEVVITQ